MRCLRGKRHLTKHIKNLVGKEGNETKADDGKDRTENFAAVKLRPTKRSEQADDQQSSAHAEENESRPRKIARDWKLGEKFIAEQPANGDNEADPDRPVPFPF